MVLAPCGDMADRQETASAVLAMLRSDAGDAGGQRTGAHTHQHTEDEWTARAQPWGMRGACTAGGGGDVVGQAGAAVVRRVSCS